MSMDFINLTWSMTQKKWWSWICFDRWVWEIL